VPAAAPCCSSACKEYAEQVGKEFAESTSHFKDALNEILAGGQSMF